MLNEINEKLNWIRSFAKYIAIVFDIKKQSKHLARPLY